MKRFNASKVRALGNLQPRTEKQKAFARRANGLKMRWSQDREAAPVKKSRDFLSCVSKDFVPAKPRGNSGTRLSAAVRAAVAARRQAREAFFASL